MNWIKKAKAAGLKVTFGNDGPKISEETIKRILKSKRAKKWLRAFKESRELRKHIQRHCGGFM